MWAKGPMPGAQPRVEALRLLPRGTTCKRVSAIGITGYVVTLPDGRAIGSAGNASLAWEDASSWARRHPREVEAAVRAAEAAAG